MSISFGSTGIKPYAGSKEVKEAYVGSQLVYRAGLPDNYAFLGAANSYMKADWAYTVSDGRIIKEGGKYRVGITGQANTGGAGYFGMSQIKGTKVKFMHIGRPVRLRAYTNLGGNSFATFPQRSEWTLEEGVIPNDEPWKTIEIQLDGGTNSAYAYLDAIRYEN